MTRLPAALVVLLLHREAAARNRPELAVTTAALWQWRKRGHIGPGPGYDLDEIMEYLEKRSRPVAAPQPCSMESCEQDVLARGYCTKHYRRLMRHDDPHHDHSRGDDVGYAAVHKRLRTSLGNASEHPCNHCAEQAKDWAYDHDDPNEQVDQRNGPYSPNPDHYRPLCVTCHRRFDQPFRKAS